MSTLCCFHSTVGMLKCSFTSGSTLFQIFLNILLWGILFFNIKWINYLVNMSWNCPCIITIHYKYKTLTTCCLPIKLPLIDKTQTSSWVEFDVVQNIPKDKDQLVDCIGSNVTKQKIDMERIHSPPPSKYWDWPPDPKPPPPTKNKWWCYEFWALGV